MFIKRIAIKNYKYHFYILFIGVVVHLCISFLLQLYDQNIIYPDSTNYLESASKMFQKFTGHYYRPMLMAFINGLPYLFGSNDAGVYKWSFFVNLFCWLGTALLLFEILKTFLSPRKSFYFALFSFSFLSILAHTFHLLTENSYIFFILLAIYFLLKYYQTQQLVYLSLGLALLFSSMLIKPGSKFLAIGFGIYFSKEIFNNYKDKRLIWLYCSWLMILIQVIGMKVQYGNFTISYIDGVTIHNYLCSKAVCLKEGKEFNQINNPRADYLFSQSLPDQKRIPKEDLIYQIKTNFPNLIRAYFSNMLENCKTGSGCIYDCQNKNKTNYFETAKLTLFTISKWQNRIFTIIGLMLAVYFFVNRKKHEKIILFSSCFIIYIIVLSGISCGQGDRFHMVTFPFTLLLLAKLYQIMSFKKA
jgi:hypothetical protein